MLGSLYIVPTPIGNLQDMSERALSILQEVDLIAAEDTRHSGQLFAHFSIRTPSISLHDHNESQRSQLLIKRMHEGQSIALVSDAGTPLISDPGYILVKACREEGINVIALPGPCALTTALSASGLPSDQFTFKGFLPVKQKAKQDAIASAAAAHSTQIFYESPRRIKNTIEVCIDTLPKEHHIVLAKELTKRFETYQSGCAAAILEWLIEDSAHQKGEFVLMIYCPLLKQEALAPEACALMEALLEHMPPKVAASVVSEHYSVNKKALYQYALSLK